MKTCTGDNVMRKSLRIKKRIQRDKIYRESKQKIINYDSVFYL